MPCISIHPIEYERFNKDFSTFCNAAIWTSDQLYFFMYHGSAQNILLCGGVNIVCKITYN